jgi:hypothetical protein
MNANQAVNRAAESASARYGNITPQEVQRAAQYVFNSPTQDDIIRYMMGQGAAQAASSPSPDEQATMMAGTPVQAPAQLAARTQQAPPSIERAIQLQNTPDQLNERDVLYQLPTRGLTSWGPADIYRRPFVDNDDGSTSTMVTSIYDDDDGYHVIAGVGSDGTMYSDNDAIRRAQEVGDNKIATFGNLADAEAFDNALHPREVMRLKYRNNPQALQQYAYDLERADHPDRFDANGNYITPQEQAAVATQAAPVASQAASTAAQVQNNATDAAGTQAAPQADYSQQLNDVIAQANRVGIGQPMSLGERGVLSQILGAKDMYNAAQDDNGRAAAHALADAYRQAGQQYGLADTSDGLDATQLRALLQTDYDMGVNNAMQGKTSAEYFDDQYNALRQAGLTRSEATDEAARRAQRYQNERVRNLTNAYYTYGVDRDGSMNNNGAAILNLIYDEQPASAAMGMQNYATPSQNWKFNKNQEAANNAYQQKLDYGQHTFDWARILNNDKFTAQEKMQAIANELQKYLANLNIDADLKKAQLNADTAVQVAGIRGADGKSGGSSGGSDGKEPTDSQKTLMENAKDIYKNSSSNLNNVGEAIANLDKIEQKLSDSDVRQRIEDMKYALNARREFVSWNDHGRTGSADNAIDYYDSVSDANKDLVDDLKGLYDSASHS